MAPALSIHSVGGMDDHECAPHPIAQLGRASTLFVREAIRNRHDVGAVAPSSTALALALTHPVEGTGRGRKVLEVGGGTGAVTYELMRRLDPSDRLDIVEANPNFAEILRTRTHRPREAGGPRTQVHRTRIEHFETATKYDLIVSGLPSANFEPDVVGTITDRYRELVATNGTITYFSFRGTRRLRALSPHRDSVRRHDEVDQRLAEFRAGFDASQRTVWANVPPARVWQLQVRCVRDNHGTEG